MSAVLQGSERVRIIHGDNVAIMNELANSEERFILAYLDPPFFSQRAYTTADGVDAFDDRWPSLTHYIDALRHWIEVARDCIDEEGCMVLHLDTSAVHEAKNICDDVFGRNCFASEIVWRYRRWPAKTRNFQAMHDTLLRYVRDPKAEPRFNQLYEPLSQSTLEQWGSGRQRAVKNAAGRRVRSVATEDAAAVPLSDVWDIHLVAPSSSERTPYPTQKPEALIVRLMDALTNEGDAVLDPFCGSGTVPAVCAKLGRRCVSIDQSAVAIRIAEARLAPILALGSLFTGLA